jgi:hypothetical protein
MSVDIYSEGSAKLFSAGVKLQTVATGLKKIIENINLNSSEKKAMTWAKSLLEQMAWHLEDYEKQKNFKMVVLATHLRPGFYHELFKLRIPFDNNYSKRAYQTLQTFGETGLEAREMTKFQNLFQQMSNSILGFLQRNIGYR